MKTKASMKYGMIATLAVLGMMIVSLMAASPAMARVSSIRDNALQNQVDINSIKDSIPDIIGDDDNPDVGSIDWDLLAPGRLIDPGIFPDLSGDEPGPSDDQPGDDQPNDDQPSNDQPSGDQPSGDQPSNDQPSGDQPSGDQPSGDQPSNDQPSGDQPNTNETTDTTQTTQTTETSGNDHVPSTQTSRLPFTGGDSTPWLIVGAVVIGAGVGLLIRRPGNDER